MSRAAQIAIGLFVVWLIVFVILQGSHVDRDTVGLIGLLPVWGPLVAIAGLSVAVWIERRLKR